MATIPGGSIPTDGDPDLANIGETRKPVELHDILTAPLAFVEKSPLQIEWVDARSQPKFDKYYQIACTNTTRGNSKYFLFVSSGYLEGFRDRDMANGEDGNITFRVTPSFHYGQKGMMGKNHFLVFHPSDRTIIFQGRFVKAAWLQYGNMADNFVGCVEGTKEIDMIDIMVDFLEDPLKEFTC